MAKAPQEILDRLRKPGRPCKFNQQIRDKLMALAGSGKTNEQIAAELGVATSTIYRWLSMQGSDLRNALKDAKGIADDMVESALFGRAIGSIVKEQKAITVRDGHGPGEFTERVETVEVYKELPPDPTSCIFWLKNRRPERWRERVEDPGETIDEIEFIDSGEAS